MSSALLRVYPSELKIPYEVKKQQSCCMQLTNRTDLFVAFKVKTTNPRKYSVRHSCGIVLPRGSCNVTVIMQAPMEMLSDHHCKDKFLVQSVVVQDGAIVKAFGPQLFTKAPGRVIEEFKLRVVYIAANPPSPVPEVEEEEDSSPRSEVFRGVETSSTFDVAHRCVGVSAAEPSCAEGTSVISGLVGEREYAVDKHQKLQQEMEHRCIGASAAEPSRPEGTSVISGLVGEREYAVDKHQKLQQEMEHRCIGASAAEPSCPEGTSVISELVGEREYAVDKHQKLQQDMELIGETRSSQQGFSLMFVVFVFMSSMFIGHLMNEIKV